VATVYVSSRLPTACRQRSVLCVDEKTAIQASGGAALCV
jgi:hypothetical protein